MNSSNITFYIRFYIILYTRRSITRTNNESLSMHRPSTFKEILFGYFHENKVLKFQKYISEYVDTYIRISNGSVEFKIYLWYLYTLWSLIPCHCQSIIHIILYFTWFILFF